MVVRLGAANTWAGPETKAEFYKEYPVNQKLLRIVEQTISQVESEVAEENAIKSITSSSSNMHLGTTGSAAVEKAPSTTIEADEEPREEPEGQHSPLARNEQAKGDVKKMLNALDDLRSLVHQIQPTESGEEAADEEKQQDDLLDTPKVNNSAKDEAQDTKEVESLKDGELADSTKVKPMTGEENEGACNHVQEAPEEISKEETQELAQNEDNEEKHSGNLALEAIESMKSFVLEELPSLVSNASKHFESENILETLRSLRTMIQELPLDVSDSDEELPLDASETVEKLPLDVSGPVEELPEQCTDNVPGSESPEETKLASDALEETREEPAGEKTEEEENTAGCEKDKEVELSEADKAKLTIQGVRNMVGAVPELADAVSSNKKWEEPVEKKKKKGTFGVRFAGMEF